MLIHKLSDRVRERAAQRENLVCLSVKIDNTLNKIKFPTGAAVLIRRCGQVSLGVIYSPPLQRV